MPLFEGYLRSIGACYKMMKGKLPLYQKVQIKSLEDLNPFVIVWFTATAPVLCLGLPLALDGAVTAKLVHG